MKDSARKAMYAKYYTINNGWNSKKQYSSTSLDIAKKYADSINGIVFSHVNGKTKNVYQSKNFRKQ